ncbi:GCN5-related N-acetyltransferase, partial [Rhizoctonia solani]
MTGISFHPLFHCSLSFQPRSETHSQENPKSNRFSLSTIKALIDHDHPHTVTTPRQPTPFRIVQSASFRPFRWPLAVNVINPLLVVRSASAPHATCAMHTEPLIVPLLISAKSIRDSALDIIDVISVPSDIYDKTIMKHDSPSFPLPISTPTTTFRVEHVSWADPAGAKLRDEQVVEISERFGTSPGKEPNLLLSHFPDDIVLFLLAYPENSDEPVACGAIRHLDDGFMEASPQSTLDIQPRTKNIY